MTILFELFAPRSEQSKETTGDHDIPMHEDFSDLVSGSSPNHNHGLQIHNKSEAKDAARLEKLLLGKKD